MRNFLRAAALLAGLVALSGCSFIGAFQDRIGNAVERYCSEPQAARESYREIVNARTAPNRIEISCEGDAPASSSSG